MQAKLENAEVLELTVRRVQGALRGRERDEWRPLARRVGGRGVILYPEHGWPGNLLLKNRIRQWYTFWEDRKSVV